MTLRIVLSGLLALSPAYAFANCGHMSQKTAMSCAEGQVLDQDTGTCVPIVNS